MTDETDTGGRQVRLSQSDDPESVLFQASQLASLVVGMEDSVTGLAGKVEVQQARTDKNVKRLNKIVAAIAVSLAIDISLTGMFAYLYEVQRHNSAQIAVVEDRTNTQVLCPLYKVLVASIQANPSPPGLTPDQVAFRKQAADTVQRGMNILGCS